jgi:hypothetical protein
MWEAECLSWWQTDLDGGYNSGCWHLIILVHQQLCGSLLINAQQLSDTLMQHWQQMMLLDEVKDCRLLLTQVNG